MKNGTIRIDEREGECVWSFLHQGITRSYVLTGRAETWKEAFKVAAEKQSALERAYVVMKDVLEAVRNPSEGFDDSGIWSSMEGCLADLVLAGAILPENRGGDIFSAWARIGGVEARVRGVCGAFSE